MALQKLTGSLSLRGGEGRTVIRIYFVQGWSWSRPGDGTPPDVVVNDGDELMALLEGVGVSTNRRIQPAQHEVLRTLAGRFRHPAQPIDVLANAAVYQVLPRA